MSHYYSTVFLTYEEFTILYCSASEDDKLLSPSNSRYNIKISSGVIVTDRNCQAIALTSVIYGE